MTTTLTQEGLTELRAMLDADEHLATLRERVTMVDGSEAHRILPEIWPSIKSILALANAAPSLLALASQSLSREAEIRREVIEECAKVAEQAVIEWKNFDGTVQAIEKLKNREIVAKSIRALAQQPDKEPPK